jgi:hypothetical protein
MNNKKEVQIFLILLVITASLFIIDFAIDFSQRAKLKKICKNNKFITDLNLCVDLEFTDLAKNELDKTYCNKIKNKDIRYACEQEYYYAKSFYEQDYTYCLNLPKEDAEYCARNYFLKMYQKKGNTDFIEKEVNDKEMIDKIHDAVLRDTKHSNVESCSIFRLQKNIDHCKNEKA